MLPASASRRRARARIVASIKTKARRDGDDYVIDGGKMWTTNGTQADWMCLLANTGDGPAHRNKSLICLPMKTKGVNVRAQARQARDARLRHRADFLRWRACAAALSCRRRGHGFIYQMQQFQEERLWAAAAGLRRWKRAIRMTIEYTAERHAFARASSTIRSCTSPGRA